jgi:Mrp family chromosome partitioning ATPase
VPSGFAGDELWAQLIRALRGAYHVVLVDAGSMRSPLPLRWARLAHRSVLVVDTSRSTEEELERLKVELESREQRIDAVILSKRQYYVPSFLYRYVR